MYDNERQRNELINKSGLNEYGAEALSSNPNLLSLLPTRSPQLPYVPIQGPASATLQTSNLLTDSICSNLHISPLKENTTSEVDIITGGVTLSQVLNVIGNTHKIDFGNGRVLERAVPSGQPCSVILMTCLGNLDNIAGQRWRGGSIMGIEKTRPWRAPELRGIRRSIWTGGSSRISKKNKKSKQARRTPKKIKKRRTKRNI